MRHKDWVNPYMDKPDGYDWDSRDDLRPAVHWEICKDVYEAGADAYEGGLKKMSQEPHYLEDLNQRVLRGGGYLVFIEEGE